jgi:multiple sugar transport system ATP-binding protein
MAQVKFEKVTKIYDGGVQAVNAIDLDIEDGSLLVLVGPSGCGKSTSLRMVAGLEDITGGTITIGDRVVNNILPKNRNIAMVFQNYALYPHMSVYNNMSFGLRLRKYSRREIEERVSGAAEMLEITPLLNRRPRELSGGQAQRVALGRAIVRNPDVFLFDEPLSNLDAKLRVQMRVEIARLHERLKATMIYVTHDQVEAMTLGDRVAVMRDGDILQVAQPMELYNRPINRFVGGFIGSPPMNFVTGTLTATDNTITFVGTDITLQLPTRMSQALKGHTDRKVLLGVRPEDIFNADLRRPPEGVPTFTMHVAVTEPLGAETLVYLYGSDDKDYIIAKLDPRSTPDVGQTVNVFLDADKCHIFDADTEESLTYDVESSA